MLLSLSLLALPLIVIYSAALVIYRLYFSPIAHIPGPKLAAVSFWYQFYYDAILQGRYLFKIKQLHEKYGPIIRMNPYEVHVIDPSFMEIMCPGAGHKRDKWAFNTQVLRTSGASLNTDPHDLHRIRRSALNPFFSKGSIRNLQPLINAKVDQILERFADLQKSGDILVVNHACAAFTNGAIFIPIYSRTLTVLTRSRCCI
jgi:hypothetical protein